MAETKTKAKAKAEPEAKDAERKLPKLDDVRHWVGLRLDGIGGRSLGRVAGLHVDPDDGEPRWVVVRLGPMAGCTAIPYEHVAEGAGRLWAAYERDWVREAPRFKVNEALSTDNELELCAHWGIREDHGRSAELKGKEPEAITAVPSDIDAPEDS
jgi:hypothetical protein